MGKSLLDIITEYSINEGMDDTLLQNEEYIKIQDKIKEQTEQLDNLNLNNEQRLIVDRLISSYTESGALYGRMTYRQGFQDCVSLLQELNLLNTCPKIGE